jgi:MFS family permease
VVPCHPHCATLTHTTPNPRRSGDLESPPATGEYERLNAQGLARSTVGEIIWTYAGSCLGAVLFGVLIDFYVHPKWCMALCLTLIIAPLMALDYGIPHHGDSRTLINAVFLCMGIGAGGAYPVSVTTAIAMTKLRVEGLGIPQEIAVIFALQGAAKFVMQVIFSIVPNPNPNPNPSSE